MPDAEDRRRHRRQLGDLSLGELLVRRVRGWDSRTWVLVLAVVLGTSAAIVNAVIHRHWLDTLLPLGILLLGSAWLVVPPVWVRRAADRKDG